ncbi:uncharacterized protein LOC129256600 isoform X1 [Lytechinus pictus]|uniref:uncharacterized protein LOC129256600 isoform X1 n=1 Tax=Lytechinus pictus TaxID=7653 RepID=UPI00240DE27E|nr:uncharacterized protein LOC129256600 isoform X1 [Lytechinus pictus]
MEFHFITWSSFMLIMSRLMTSHALSHGPGRCWNTISALITVRETFMESMTKRTATCCDWFCTSKCSSYRVVYRTAYRNALRTTYKIDLGCCPGWRPQEGHCVPASIPDGPAEATLMPFQPGNPKSNPRSSGAHQGDTGTSKGTVERGASNSGKSHLGRGGGKDQRAGTASGTKPINHQPRLPGLDSAAHQGDVYVIKKSRSDAWATSHPVEMSVIVGLLGIVIVVILVGWTMYKKRISRDHIALIQLYKAEESSDACEAGAFQYEVLPKTEGANQHFPAAASASSTAEEHVYQNFPIVKSRALYHYKNSQKPQSEEEVPRGNLYEINLPEEETDARYTMLNVGDRQSSSSYTPLQNTPSTTKEDI